jgi:hypothetical protein
MKMIFAAILTAALAIQAPTLTYTQGDVKPFVATTIPADATFACIEYASLDQPGYTPSKCLNFEAGKLSSYENDWSFVNCTIDQVMANDVYCGDGKEWDVRVYTETPAENSRTYSNIVRVVYPKPVLVIR